MGLARKQNDYITINFLQWFLTEQLEEVSSMDSLLKILERAGNDLLQADEYLARVGVRAMPEPPNSEGSKHPTLNVPAPNAEVRLCRRDNGSYDKINAVDSCIVSGL